MFLIEYPENIVRKFSPTPDRYWDSKWSWILPRDQRCPSLIRVSWTMRVEWQLRQFLNAPMKMPRYAIHSPGPGNIGNWTALCLGSHEQRISWLSGLSSVTNLTGDSPLRRLILFGYSWISQWAKGWIPPIGLKISITGFEMIQN